MDIDDNIDLPVVINKNDELKNINISVAMWVGFIIGMLMGACVCGFANQLSNMVYFMNFIEISVTWWVWLILITFLSILFLVVESKFKTRIEV
jgi:hypothetical protein